VCVLAGVMHYTEVRLAKKGLGLFGVPLTLPFTLNFMFHSIIPGR